MSLEQVLATQGTAEIHALIPTEPSSTPPVRVPSTSSAGLTTREMDVLRLLAGGLTSAQIASGWSSAWSPSIPMCARFTASWTLPREPLRPDTLWITTYCKASPSRER
jgi:hypothetical protein